MEINLLVVDDELLLRDVLYDFLIKKSFNVFLASDGYKALEIVDKNHIDIAIVDIKMPGLSGIELTEKLLRIDDRIQVIIMTGYPSVDSAVKAMKLGAKEYLVKPFRLMELFNLINKLLHNKAGYDEIKKLEEELEKIKKGEKLSKEKENNDKKNTEDGSELPIHFPQRIRDVAHDNNSPVVNRKFAENSYSNFANSGKKKKINELLNRLDELLASGIISEKEYLSKKSEIINTK